jgi:hypothetical protein
MKENRGEITMKEHKHRLCARVVAGVSWLAKLRLRKGPVAADTSAKPGGVFTIDTVQSIIAC